MTNRLEGASRVGFLDSLNRLLASRRQPGLTLRSRGRIVPGLAIGVEAGFRYATPGFWQLTEAGIELVQILITFRHANLVAAAAS